MCFLLLSISFYGFLWYVGLSFNVKDGAEAPVTHQTMKMEDRVLNAMSGFVALDLFRLVADSQCAKAGLPKGSFFLAAEIARNLQHCVLGLLQVCVSKSAHGCPFRHGYGRLSEISIEQWFGRLRTQSTSAELSTRSFWNAAARDMLKCRYKNKDQTSPPEDLLEPISAAEFYQASEKAFKAALRLVSWCAGITPESLQNTYDNWCTSGMHRQDGPLLGDEYDDYETSAPEGPKSKAEQTKSTLKHIVDEATLQENEEDAPEDADAEPDLMSHDLRGFPDGEDLQKLLQDTLADDDSGNVNSEEGGAPDGVPRNLHHALWTMGPRSTDTEVLDSLWRLTMALRHWSGGSDRQWIANPRNCRRKSGKLNWHQYPGWCFAFIFFFYILLISSYIILYLFIFSYNFLYIYILDYSSFFYNLPISFYYILLSS